MMVWLYFSSKAAGSIPALRARNSRAALLPASTRGGSACLSMRSTTLFSLSSSRSATSPAESNVFLKSDDNWVSSAALLPASTSGTSSIPAGPPAHLLDIFC